MSIVVTPCAIEGLFEVQPKVFGDNRGYFFESYSERDFRAAGLSLVFVQDNQSRSSRGVLRGLHYQKTHPQGKLVRVIEGEVFDVAVDIRPGSPSRGRWFAVILRGDRQNQFYIPPGFAHGFLVLSETAVFAYKCTDFYYPEDEGGIIWNDPAIGIPWPDLGIEYLLSEKDARLPGFASLDGVAGASTGVAVGAAGTASTSAATGTAGVAGTASTSAATGTVGAAGTASTSAATGTAGAAGTAAESGL